jgi:hypothetical protein
LDADGQATGMTASAFLYQDFLNILRGLGPMGRCWTLHGGGAVVYHFRHRDLTELDIYKEPSCSVDEAASVAIPCLRPLLSPDFLEQTEGYLRLGLDESSVVKVAFEKVTLSFVKKPKNKGTQNRVVFPPLLPVASVRDALGGKIYALHERNALHDYSDIAEALARDFSMAFLLDALQSVAISPIDLRVLFDKMVRPPDDIAAQLSERDKLLLRQAGEQGLATAGPIVKWGSADCP